MDPVRPHRDGAGELTYLDHASTAPVLPEVLEAMRPFFGPRFGNPSGSHRVARDAAAALEGAREEVAEVLGAQPGEVVFTGSGTESDNLAVLGSIADRPSARVVVCSAIEHTAVLEACRAATEVHGAGGAGDAHGAGGALRVAPAGPDGLVDLGRLDELLTGEVALVSVMLANNEVGTIQPLETVIRRVRRRCPDALVHTDAVQAAPWLDLASLTKDADLVSISAHKCGGPKGMGVLVARGGAAVDPLVHGGGQERGRRSGTQNVAGAVGTAVALRSVQRTREAEGARVAALRDRLAQEITARVGGAHVSAPLARLLPGHCPVWFEDIEQEDLLVLLDEHGVCASAGSACASGALEPSHVLLAMGMRAVDARGALRLTLGRTTTAADVDRAVEFVVHAVGTLRGDRGAHVRGQRAPSARVTARGPVGPTALVGD